MKLHDISHLEYEFEYLRDHDDITGLNDLISHDNLSDFNDLDCLFNLKKYKKCFRLVFLEIFFHHQHFQPPRARLCRER